MSRIISHGSVRTHARADDDGQGELHSEGYFDLF